MTASVIALIDRPDDRSFGIVPFVAEIGERLSVCGIERWAGVELDRTEYDALLREGSGRALDAAIALDEPPPATMAAGWIGPRFLEDARAQEVDPLRWKEALGLPHRLYPRLQGAQIWIDEAPRVYTVLDKWLLFAAKRAFDALSGGTNIARLMRWTLPDRIETRAAMVLLEPDPDRRAERLAHYLRRSHESDAPATPEALQAELERVRETYLRRAPSRLRRLPERRPFAQHAGAP
jgi:hypothetical protein